MKIVKSSASALVAAFMTLSGSQFAHAQAVPYPKFLPTVEELARELVRLDNERAEAEAERVKAKEELETLHKQNPQAKAQADAIEKRIKDAEDTIKRIDATLGRNCDAKAKKPEGEGANKDIAADLEKLAEERDKAEAAITKAKAELDALNKQNPKAKEQADAIHRRISEAEAKIKHANDILGKKPIKSVEYKTNNSDEAKEAQKLPQKLDELIKKITKKLHCVPYADVGNKSGGCRFEWLGNP